MNYLIRSEFEIGDIVYPKLSPENKFLVIGFEIMASDEMGNVNNHLVHCSGGDGDIIRMYEYELERNIIRVD